MAKVRRRSRDNWGCQPKQKETIPKGGIDTPGIERNDRPASPSVKWGGDKSSDSSARKLKNMMNVNQVVRGTSSMQTF